MTARDDLIDMLKGYYHIPSEWADDLLATHAHELAEKIRAQIKHPDDYTCVPCTIYALDANLIDPEVNK